MAAHESHDIESATTALLRTATPQLLAQAPDQKTRRYDRQLRLWATTGQRALETSRLLLLSGSATSNSILKNLVLPGIGHFTIMDAHYVTPEDAGNNFFLDGPNSVGKNRAEEAVKFLNELNDGVEGVADKSDLASVLKNNPNYITSFTLVIAHNLPKALLTQLSTLLWSDRSHPPLIVVRTAGFLADFFIQNHEHTVIDSHSENTPSLRIDQPFPALLEHATSLDLDAMDPTDHGHVPYIVLLARAMSLWKAAHGDKPPQSYAEKQEFKKQVSAMKKKHDDENVEEAEAQAYRAWTETKVPSEIADLFNDPILESPFTADTPPFFRLLNALKEYTETVKPYTLPLTSTLPDMKSDTKSYIHLQNLYKARAEEEKVILGDILKKQGGLDGQGTIDQGILDDFYKNAHGLKVIRGQQWEAFVNNPESLKGALEGLPKETATLLALTALTNLHPNVQPSEDELKGEVLRLVGRGVELPDEADEAIGELVRAPTADLPTTASFVGGLVAQEAIKLITKQYVPVLGYCVIDLVGSWTGVVGAS